jgi:GPH family glycoside/pentoside/hexuronide:cation symporter
MTDTPAFPSLDSSASAKLRISEKEALHEAPQRLTMRIMATAGAGQMVESLSSIVFTSFLFFYYTAILGLPGSLVGAATAITLAIDAIADPLLGSVSDNFRSRWGRRTPFMLAGAPLVALGLGLVFSPPAGLGAWGLFAWLVAMSLLMRFSVSIFQVPFLALGAELSEDYAERSSVVAWRTLFSIVGPVLILILGYGVFLGGKLGLRNAHGYAPLAWSAAALILVGGLVAVMGVRRFASALAVGAKDDMGLHRRLLSELKEIFKNPSFRVLLTASVLFFAAQGLVSNMNQYMNVFVWRISSAQILLINLCVFAGLIVGVPLAPGLARRLEKRTMSVVGLVMFCIAQGGVTSLRALGLFTPTGAAAVAPLALNWFVAGVGLAFVGVASGSMMADAADEHDYLFGARREGLYFAGLSFAAKAAAGLGGLMAGVALDAIHFPKMAAAQGVSGQLTPSMLSHLVWSAGPAAAAVSLVATGVMLLYRIDRRRHDEITATLRARRLAGP